MNTVLRQTLRGRIASLLDDAVISEKTRVRPATIKIPAGESPEVTEARLRKALESIFIPTRQVRRIIKQIIGASLGFSDTRYNDGINYLRHVYEKKPPTGGPTSTAICLTGLAGVGKSALVGAIERLMQIDERIFIDHGHDPFPSNHCIGVSFREHRTIGAVLRKISYPDGEAVPPRTRMDVLTKQVRWRAFRDFSMLMIADESQFITRGNDANTAATDILLTLMGIDVLLVYVANYSLCHKLKRRPQEDRHRLLSRPIVMEPEVPGTEDWREYLAECTRVAGRWLRISVEGDERTIFQMTFGIKRIVVHLVCLAYRQMVEDGRKTVTLEDLQASYLSLDNMHRREVEELLAQMNSGRKPSKDLLCPFDSDSPLSHVADQMKLERDVQIVHNYTEQSLNVFERKALDTLNRKISGAPQTPSAPKSRPPVQPLSAAGLLAGYAKLRESAQQRR
ncbi:hypothetical protein ACTJK4_23000 [Ralstonia sp. 22111]|uniref:hypothetical protein n=1 Tax=Ralstonia sp. 22111 TaxID=3453878 RepID=UPI003F851874